MKTIYKAEVPIDNEFREVTYEVYFDANPYEKQTRNSPEVPASLIVNNVKVQSIEGLEVFSSSHNDDAITYFFFNLAGRFREDMFEKLNEDALDTRW